MGQRRFVDAKYLRKLAILLLAVIPSLGNVGRAEGSRRYSVYFLGTEPIEFITSKDGLLTLSKDCIRGDRKLTCKAMDVVPYASTERIQPLLKGERGQNPGALVCRNLGGRNQIGLDHAGNQSGFCQFSDGSLISTASLHYFGRRNDRATINRNLAAEPKPTKKSK